METYINKYHAGHIYLRMDSDAVMTEEQLNQILVDVDKPIQVNVDAEWEKANASLKALGFQLVRVCSCMKVGKGDLNCSLSRVTSILETSIGKAEYDGCVKMLYQHYKDTHESVNPLTATLDEFKEILPAKAIFYMTENTLQAAAFIEENEIAYLCGRDKDCLAELLPELVAYMFEQYDTLEFEADDTDWAATYLRGMFCGGEVSVYNTYVKGEVKNDF